MTTPNPLIDGMMKVARLAADAQCANAPERGRLPTSSSRVKGRMSTATAGNPILAKNGFKGVIKLHTGWEPFTPARALVLLYVDCSSPKYARQYFSAVVGRKQPNLSKRVSTSALLQFSYSMNMVVPGPAASIIKPMIDSIPRCFEKESKFFKDGTLLEHEIATFPRSPGRGGLESPVGQPSRIAG